MDLKAKLWDVISEMQLSGRGTRLAFIKLKGVNLKPESFDFWGKGQRCTGAPGPNGRVAKFPETFIARKWEFSVSGPALK